MMRLVCAIPDWPSEASAIHTSPWSVGFWIQQSFLTLLLKLLFSLIKIPLDEVNLLHELIHINNCFLLPSFLRFISRFGIIIFRFLGRCLGLGFLLLVPWIVYGSFQIIWWGMLSVFASTLESQTDAEGFWLLVMLPSLSGWSSTLWSSSLSLTLTW